MENFETRFIHSWQKGVIYNSQSFEDEGAMFRKFIPLTGEVDKKVIDLLIGKFSKNLNPVRVKIMGRSRWI